MRISQKTEWVLVAVLILYIAFTPGLPVVREFLSSGVGKAVGLAVIIATWKYVSPAVALLLTVNFVRCSGMREYLESGSGSTGSGSGSTGSGSGSTGSGTTGSGSSASSGSGTTGSGTTLPPNTYCPENHSFDNGQCKNNTTGQSTPATVCLTGQTWNGTSCSGSSSASTPDTKQGFANMTPASFAHEGFQPNTSGKDKNFAPA
jgi:hypothetical protein